MTALQEIKPSMIEPKNPNMTFKESEIQDGDIICYQEVLNSSE